MLFRRAPLGRAIRYKSGKKANAQNLHGAFRFYPSRIKTKFALNVFVSFNKRNKSNASL